jgi:capsular exopolysaccharide synthesis family protein
MSRIQNILDKAEREGSVRRVRIAEQSPAAAAGVGLPSGIVPSPAPPEPGGALQADPIGAVAAPSPPVPVVRVAAGVQLDRRLIGARGSDSLVAEQYRALRTRILHADNGAPVAALLITSPGRGEGKTLTAANLALTMAQEYQQRICIVDADMRQPQVHQLFGVADTPGLSDVLAGRAALDEALITIEEHQVTVLPAGRAPGHPAELLGTISMRRALDSLRSQFDRVVIDAPAATLLADVGILTPLVDSVLLVVRAGVTAKPAIHDAIAALDGSKLLGVVLNEAA